MSAKKSQELKQLQTRKTKLEVDVHALESEAKEKQQAHDKALNQLEAVNRQIKELTDSEIVVSEHAVIRYMERAMGLDVEEIKQKILSESTVSQIKCLGSGKYPIGEGLKAVVKDNTVVSVA